MRRNRVGQLVPALGTSGMTEDVGLGVADTPGVGVAYGLGETEVPGVASGLVEARGVGVAEALGVVAGLTEAPGVVPGEGDTDGPGEVAKERVKPMVHCGSGTPSTALGLDLGAVGATGFSSLSLIAVSTAKIPRKILTRAINRNGQFFFNTCISLLPQTDSIDQYTHLSSKEKCRWRRKRCRNSIDDIELVRVSR